MSCGLRGLSDWSVKQPCCDIAQRAQHTGSANDQVCDIFEAGDRDTNASPMANTLHDFAVAIYLPQFALGIVLVSTMDHQVVYDNTFACSDTKSIFNELMGLHETPFTSIESNHYMQRFPQTQAIYIILLSIFSDGYANR
ncbi:MAG: hypothetical protein K9K30_01520 [Burkholderiaceae bacterium]|nr:hypothetical protein [Sulfuritalea sp.]MCF8173908.1 hypothetical protein [Burkholderiaceae bacterium]MCF8183720.1 hypothetical protein [Polynucleobacter sp.]